ncbi:hypothetical protein [Lactococcus lactis]|uniref:hypothetical protein n=1 Tax=Lactococcus lactis TaxID=1358 RepID=UPI0023A9F7DF|nr:hypothetical protein [Lactococcus lactis]WEA54422.1 hypothetical protein PWP91_09055 [Lactococcus lactis]
MKKTKTKFIAFALASADSVESTTLNSTPAISLRSNVEFQGDGSKQLTYIKDYANGYLAYDNCSKDMYM